MKVGSLFAGIGGFDLGFERAGIASVWQGEIDPKCQETLTHHFPNTERYSDVHDCHSKYYLDKAVREWYPVNTEQEAIMAGKLRMAEWKDVGVGDYVEVEILDKGHRWDHVVARGNILKRFEDGTMQLDSKDSNGCCYEVQYGDTLLDHRPKDSK